MTGLDEQLIDVHSHFVTPSYIEAAITAGHSRPDGMPAYPQWSPAEHLAFMDQNRIRTSVLSISSPGTHFGDDAAAGKLSREVNEYAAELVRDHPGRFGHFASLPLPDVQGALAEIAYALDELGSDGVTVETNIHGRYLGHEDFEPVWQELDRRGAAVFVHPTSPPSAQAVANGRPRPMLEFIFDSTRAAADLLFTGVFTRYPNIQWIFTHCGGALPLLTERLELFRGALFNTGAGSDNDKHNANANANDNHTPTAAEQLRGLWFDMAGTPFPRQIDALDAAFGVERLLYGSDYCWTPAPLAAVQIASVDAAPQPADQTWRHLTTRNAVRLLPRLGA
jgi:6-methylsalicylate decarboxylase